MQMSLVTFMFLFVHCLCLQLDAVVIFDQREWKNPRQEVLNVTSFLHAFGNACFTVRDHISVYITVIIVHTVNNRFQFHLNMSER